MDTVNTEFALQFIQLWSIEYKMLFCNRLFTLVFARKGSFHNYGLFQESHLRGRVLNFSVKAYNPSRRMKRSKTFHGVTRLTNSTIIQQYYQYQWRCFSTSASEICFKMSHFWTVSLIPHDKGLCGPSITRFSFKFLKKKKEEKSVILFYWGLLTMNVMANNIHLIILLVFFLPEHYNSMLT